MKQRVLQKMQESLDFSAPVLTSPTRKKKIVDGLEVVSQRLFGSIVKDRDQEQVNFIAPHGLSCRGHVVMFADTKRLSAYSYWLCDNCGLTVKEHETLIRTMLRHSIKQQRPAAL